MLKRFEEQRANREIVIFVNMNHFISTLPSTIAIHQQNTFNPTTPNTTTTTTVPTTDNIDVSLVASVLMCTLSAAVFLLSCLLLLFYQYNKSGAYIIESRIGLVAFFVGTLLTTVTSLSAHSYKEVYGSYILVLALAVGIIVLIAGNVFLFDSPSHQRTFDDNYHFSQSVGHSHPSMGVIIWVITIPLCILEMFFAIAATTKNPHPFYSAYEFVSLLQKLVQASVYHFSLRHKVPKCHIRMGCSWFFKILSLLNFAFWIDSIVTTQQDNQYIQDMFGKEFSIIKTSFNALIIDYRLLCSMLFLEHALEIEESSRAQFQGGYEVIHEVGFDQQWGRLVARVNISHRTGYGYVIGLIWIGLQLVNGLQYFTKFVGSWTNLFPIMADVFVIVIGLWLLTSTRPLHTEVQFIWRDTESKAMDVMVGFLGTISFVFWFMKAVFCSVWTVEHSHQRDYSTYCYLAWTSAKDFVRALGILFQLHFFIKMGPNFCLSREPCRSRIKHVLVPAILLVLLSLFIAAVIDQYDGVVEQLFAKAPLPQIIRVYFNVAAPIHLVFCLHMFLHFFIINKRMSCGILPRQPNEFAVDSGTCDMDKPEAPVTQETTQPVSNESINKQAVETEEGETTPLLTQTNQHQSLASDLSDRKTAKIET